MNEDIKHGNQYLNKSIPSAVRAGANIIVSWPAPIAIQTKSLARAKNTPNKYNLSMASSRQMQGRIDLAWTCLWPNIMAICQQRHKRRGRCWARNPPPNCFIGAKLSVSLDKMLAIEGMKKFGGRYAKYSAGHDCILSNELIPQSNYRLTKENTSWKIT